jgi:ribonuclease HII
MKEYEDKLYKQGVTNIAGVDEVGRGPLFGPVVAACVVLPSDFYVGGLTDSKKLSEKKRNYYYDIIISSALDYSVALIEPSEIDEINIYQASKKAMIEAINKINIKIEHVLIDAMPLELDIPSTSIIKGDAKSITIAASSIIAKVTRDKLMYEIDLKYPMYGFKNHKGYPTKKHIEAIYKHGLIEGYRHSYGPIIKYKEEMLK